MSSKAGEKSDPRVRRTRKLLVDSLLALLKEKSFEAITVQDITERAEVNRTTFYLHFEDKYALLTGIMTEMLDVLTGQLAALEEANFNFDPAHVPPPMVALFEHLGQEADFYRAVLGRRGNPLFVVQMQTYMEQSIMSWLERHFAQHSRPEIPFIILSRYTAAARIGVIEWWLDNHQPYPPQVMAGWVWTMLVSGSVPLNQRDRLTR